MRIGSPALTLSPIFLDKQGPNQTIPLNMSSTYWQHVSRSEVQNKFRRQQAIKS